MHVIVLMDRRLKLEKMAEIAGFLNERVTYILNVKLGMLKLTEGRGRVYQYQIKNFVNLLQPIWRGLKELLMVLCIDF